MGPPFRWDGSRRAVLRCELDAAFFIEYGLTREEADAVLESFWVVRNNDTNEHGDFRPKLQILGIYDRMHRAIDSGESYQTALRPPPADPRVAHPESSRPAWMPARGPVPVEVPPMPDIVPALDPRTQPAFVVWAMVHAAAGSISRLRLARALALRSDPDLLARVAPPDLQPKAVAWAARAVRGSASAGTLASTLQALSDRDGVRLTTDGTSQSVVSTSPHTPAEEQLDAWFRFEARLALRVLDALPATSLGEVDSMLADADRALVQAGGG